MADNILSDFGINILEEEIDDVIFQTNEFLTDATFTGSQGPFWWILQMCMALAALFSIIVAASMAYKMMVKNEPLDVMKLFKPLVVSIILCWWYPPADTGMTNSGSSWCVLDFLSYIPNCIGTNAVKAIFSFEDLIENTNTLLRPFALIKIVDIYAHFFRFITVDKSC